MHPGQHVIVIGTNEDALRARAQGFTLRDTVTILLPGPQVVQAFLCRMPLEGTVAGNVLKHGCGGLDIDGCRVGTTKRVPGGLSRTAGNSLCGSKDGSLRHETGEESGHNPNVGRWPPNLLLVHGEGCRRVGERRVEAHAAFGKPGDSKGGILNKTGAPRKNPHPGFAGPEGLETVAAWECQDGCPVKALDGVSGFLHGAGNKRATQTSPFSNVTKGQKSAEEAARTRVNRDLVQVEYAVQWVDCSNALVVDWAPGAVINPLRNVFEPRLTDAALTIVDRAIGVYEHLLKGTALAPTTVNTDRGEATMSSDAELVQAHLEAQQCLLLAFYRATDGNTLRVVNAFELGVADGLDPERVRLAHRQLLQRRWVRWHGSPGGDDEFLPSRITQEGVTAATRILSAVTASEKPQPTVQQHFHGPVLSVQNAPHATANITVVDIDRHALKLLLQQLEESIRNGDVKEGSESDAIEVVWEIGDQIEKPQPRKAVLNALNAFLISMVTGVAGNILTDVVKLLATLP